MVYLLNYSIHISSNQSRNFLAAKVRGALAVHVGFTVQQWFLGMLMSSDIERNGCKCCFQ